MERFFPGAYELVTPGADREVEGWWPGSPDFDTVAEADAQRPVRIAFCLQEERGALRLFPDRPRGWPLLLQGGQRWLRSPRPAPIRWAP